MVDRISCGAPLICRLACWFTGRGRSAGCGHGTSVTSGVRRVFGCVAADVFPSGEGNETLRVGKSRGTAAGGCQVTVVDGARARVSERGLPIRQISWISLYIRQVVVLDFCCALTAGVIGFTVRFGHDPVTPLPNILL